MNRREYLTQMKDIAIELAANLTITNKILFRREAYALAQRAHKVLKEYLSETKTSKV